MSVGLLQGQEVGVEVEVKVTESAEGGGPSSRQPWGVE